MAQYRSEPDPVARVRLRSALRLAALDRTRSDGGLLVRFDHEFGARRRRTRPWPPVPVAVTTRTEVGLEQPSVAGETSLGEPDARRAGDRVGTGRAGRPRSSPPARRLPPPPARPSPRSGSRRRRPSRSARLASPSRSVRPVSPSRSRAAPETRAVAAAPEPERPVLDRRSAGRRPPDHHSRPGTRGRPRAGAAQEPPPPTLSEGITLQGAQPDEPAAPRFGVTTVGCREAVLRCADQHELEGRRHHRGAALLGAHQRAQHRHPARRHRAGDGRARVGAVGSGPRSDPQDQPARHGARGQHPAHRSGVPSGAGGRGAAAPAGGQVAVAAAHHRHAPRELRQRRRDRRDPRSAAAAAPAS